MAWQYHPKIECDYFEERIGVWKDIVRFIGQPKKYAEKSLIPLWSFYSLVHQRDREHSVNGTNWRACSANMDTVNALQIDYDNGVMTIDQFITDHADLMYGLYTSPSHTEAHEKFRVVIPLKAPLLNAYLQKGKVREYLLAMFPECDQTTINTFRKQRMPAQPMSGDAYRFHIGAGARLDLDFAEIARLSALMDAQESTVGVVDMSEEIDPFDTPIGQIDTVKELHRLLAKYREELPILKNTPRGGGTVHAGLTRMTSALGMAGMGFDDMCEFFAEFGFTGTETLRIIKWSTRKQ